MLLLAVLLFVKCSSIEIDLKKIRSYTFCSGDVEIVSIKDPFSRDYVWNDNLKSMTWYMVTKGGKVPVVIYHPLPEFLLEGFDSYEIWGLEIKGLLTNATFIAIMDLGDVEAFEVAVDLHVMHPPKLQGDFLTTEIVRAEKPGFYTFRCGPIASRGKPVIHILWLQDRGFEGKVIYYEGYAEMLVPEKEVNAKWMCRLDTNIPNYRCIRPQDRIKWQDVYVREGSFSPALTIEAYNQSKSLTTCRVGLMEGKDSFEVSGTLTINSTDLHTRGKVNFQIRKKGDFHYTNLCILSLDLRSCSGGTMKYGRCFCISEMLNTYKLTLNAKAVMGFSSSQIRIFWPETNSIVTGLSSRSVDFPEVYSQTLEVPTLLQNGEATEIEDCRLVVSRDKDYKYTFCVSNLHHPTVFINFNRPNYTRFKVDDTCITRTIKMGDSDVMFAFSYTERLPGCGRRGRIKCELREDHSSIIILIITFAAFLISLIGSLCAYVRYFKREEEVFKDDGNSYQDSQDSRKETKRKFESETATSYMYGTTTAITSTQDTSAMDSTMEPSTVMEGSEMDTATESTKQSETTESTYLENEADKASSVGRSLWPFARF